MEVACTSGVRRVSEGKFCRGNSSFVKIWHEYRVLYTKSFPHLWQCLAEFFLDWEVFETKVVKKTKIHILCSVTFFFFRKSCRLWDNVDKCGGAIGTTNNVIIWRIRVACWMTKATNAHSEYVILFALPRRQWLRERLSVLRHTYIASLVCM